MQNAQSQKIKIRLPRLDSDTEDSIVQLFLLGDKDAKRITPLSITPREASVNAKSKQSIMQ